MAQFEWPMFPRKAPSGAGVEPIIVLNGLSCQIVSQIKLTEGTHLKRALPLLAVHHGIHRHVRAVNFSISINRSESITYSYFLRPPSLCAG